MTTMYQTNSSLIQDLNSNNSSERRFALCESCFWSATIFKSKVQSKIMTLYECPICFERNISLIPLAANEIYQLSLPPKGVADESFIKKLQ
jgi:hypothetical protein